MARNKYPEETYQLILDVSTRLFFEKGYEQTSLQDIIDGLGGLTKGAIYYHFRSKEEILIAVVERMSEENSVMMKEIRDDPALTGKENLLYGYAEGVMAVGSLCGGMGAGLLAGKMKPEKGYLLLFYDALTLIPIGLALMLPVPAIVSYGIIMVSCFVMMFLATLFSIQIMSYLQMIVPGNLIGKVISCAMCIGMCATPIGQAIYGGLFEILKGKAFGLFFTVTVLVVLLAFAMKNPFARLAEFIEK